MAGNTVRIGTQVTGVGKASSDLDNLRDRFDRLQKQGAKGFAIGVGAAVTTAGLNLLGNAASKAVDFLGDVVKAGMEEEASISRLGASLKANVPNWDGNTDAIERVLSAQMRLGFSDDEQRDSLARLVPATHDVTKALDIQRTAMDLARFKRISLAEATDALTKVEAGSYRILKSLGIVLEDNATQTEALAAVQAVAAGQAAEFAEKTSGKLLVAQTKFGEKMDELGTKTLPLVTTGLDAATTGVDVLGNAWDFLYRAFGQGDAIDFATKKAAELKAEHDRLAAGLSNTSAAAHAFTERMDETAATAKSATVALDGLTDEERAAAAKAAELRVAAAMLTPKIDGLAGAANDAGAAFQQMSDRFDTTWSHLSAIASGAAEDIYGPQIRASELAANKREQAAQRAIIASAKSTAAEKRDAKDRLLALQQEGLGIGIEMAGRGELTKAAYATLIAKLSAQARSGNAEIATSAKLALAELAKLKAGVDRINAVTRPWTSPSGLHGKAAGGPASGLTMVGEKGPEIVDLPPGSFVHSNAESRRMAAAAPVMFPAMGGGAVNFYVTANLSPTGYSPAQAEQIANAVGPAIATYLRRRGLLSA